jgi:O-antigen/teichoic acid export membrane protein
MSLATKLIRGSSVTLLEHVVKIAAMFVTTPLMVVHLGKEAYGTWIVALTIIGYLRLFDLGVSFSGNRFLARALGAGDEAQYHHLVDSLIYLYQRIALLALATTLLLSLALPPFLPDESFLGATRWLVLGLGLTTALRFWTRIYEVVLKSHLRYDQIGLATLAKTIVQALLVIVALKQGRGLNSLLLVYVLSDVLDQVLLVVFSRRILPVGVLPRFKRPGDLPALARYSVSAVMATLGNQLRQGVDPLVIGHFSGLAQVSSYSIGSRFLTLFTDLVNAAFGGNFVAAFSQLDGRNDPASLTRNFLTTLKFSSTVAVFGGAAIAIFGPTFIARWVGPTFTDATRVLLLLSAPTTLMLMQYPVWGFFYSQNRQHWLAFTALAGGAFNLIFSIALVLQIGFIGVVWATVVELTLAFGIIVPVLVSRFCKIPIHRYYWDLLRPVLPYLLYAWAFHSLATFVLVPEYPRLILLGLVYCAGAVPLFWFLTLAPEERAKVASRFLKKRKPASR